MSQVERVREIVLPVIESANAELYDIEHESGILRIMVDQEGGIDVDTIGELSQQISDALDLDDPFPNQRYLLEVTSPGIERKLRTPEHFHSQLGEDINVKLHSPLDGQRRLQGRLVSSDDTSIEITIDSDGEEVTRRLNYDEIDTARVIFHWEEQTTSPGSKKQGRKNNNSIKNAGKKSASNKKA